MVGLAQQNESLASKARVAKDQEAELVKSNKTIKTIQKQHKELTAETTRHQTARKKAEGKIDQLESKLSACADELEATKKATEQAGTELKKMEKKNAQHIREGQTELLDKITVLETDLLNKTEEVEELTQKRKNDNSSLKDSKKQVKNLKTKCTKVENSLEEIQLSVTTSKERITSLEEECNDWKNESEKRSKQVKKLIMEIETKNKELDDMEDELEQRGDVLEASLVKDKSVITKLKEKVDSKNNELTELRTTLKNTISEANDKIDRLHEENVRVEGIANQYRNELEEFGRKQELRHARASTVANILKKEFLESADDEEELSQHQTKRLKPDTPEPIVEEIVKEITDKPTEETKEQEIVSQQLIESSSS